MNQQLGKDELAFCYRQGMHEITLVCVEIAVKPDPYIDGHTERYPDNRQIIKYKKDNGDIGKLVFVQDAVLQ